MFSVWLVFTSNLNSQSTWLKVKFKLFSAAQQTFAILFQTP